MNMETMLGLIGILATAGFSIWAINDARKQVRKQTLLQRNLAWAQVQNELVWLFVDPAEKVLTKEIAKGLSEFAMLSKVLNPERRPEGLKEAAVKGALEAAGKLVTDGHATWKEDLDLARVRKVLADWAEAKNTARAQGAKC